MYKFSLLRSSLSRHFLAAAIPSKLTCRSYVSNVKMKVIPVPRIIPKTYRQKNADLKRVLSPHLSIYKTQITSLLSITLRMTGFALGIMAWVVGAIEFFSEKSADYYINQLQKLDLDDCYWTAAKTIVVFPFSFHYVAGVRHLMFDTSKLLEKPQFYATGYTAIAAALSLALYLGTIESFVEKQSDTKKY